MGGRKTGYAGEDIALNYLIENGFKIITRNYVHSHGEIDIIAEDNGELVFIEVKYRKNLEYGYPEESISKSKIRLVKRTAEAYLYENEIYDSPVRFDVIAILEIQKGKQQIKHIKYAF